MPLTLNVLSVTRPNGDALITRISTAADGTQANDGTYNSRVSADGHYVMFESDATHLGAGPVSGIGDVFRKNLLTGTVELISILPRLCRSKTGSAARAGSSSKLKNDTGTPGGIVTSDSQPAWARVCADRRAMRGSPGTSNRKIRCAAVNAG